MVSTLWGALAHRIGPKARRRMTRLARPHLCIPRAAAYSARPERSPAPATALIRHPDQGLLAARLPQLPAHEGVPDPPRRPVRVGERARGQGWIRRAGRAR